MKNISLLILILTLLALAACSPGGSAESAPQPKTVTLVATDITYDAERVEAAVGQTVRLTLDNQGVLTHDFSIVEIPLSGEAITTEHAEQLEDHDMDEVDEEPVVHVAAGAGDHGTIEFTPVAPGEYEFYCTVSGHREAGMVGVLVVE